MTTKNKFKNSYSTIGIKKEYFKKYEADDMTDQSQLASASITEMAKKYGIDALIAKANKPYIDNPQLQDQLFGHDFTAMQTSKEELLNVKKKVTNLFNNIPAGIRKSIFNDNIHDFLDTYTSTDENKLTALRDIGLISETQLNSIKNYNKAKVNEKLESQKRKEFITKLEQQQGELYETFKATGNITINNDKNNTINNENVQRNLQ